MKQTGIARRIDELGRLVIPAELRRLFGISPGDAVDICVEGDAIVLRKLDVACVFCDGVTNLRPYRERHVCEQCVASLQAVEDRAAEPAPPGSSPQPS